LKNDAKRRDAYPSDADTRHIFCSDGSRGANAHEVGEPTPSVATPFFATTPQYAIFGTDEPRDAVGHDFIKLAPSVATPPKDTTFTADEPPDAIGNDAGKPMQSVATPIAYLWVEISE
jgi:hypothetical protein